MTKVFISHATLDREIVFREIVYLLKRHGVDVWYSDDDIAPSQYWERSIKQGLEECEWFLVALTKNALQSEWVRDEVHWAIENRSADRIIQCMLEPCDAAEIHIRLPRLQQIEFLERSDRAKQRLLNCWKLPLATEDSSKPRSEPLGGRYKIIEGWVQSDYLTEYSAFDCALRRKVIVKAGKNDRPQPTEFNPIMNEAHLTSEFRHLAIPRVYDLANDEELGCYSVLEMVQGKFLRSMEMPFSVTEAIRVVKDLAAAVHYAHERGVLHCNIKPSSVFVDDEQQVHLMNWILACEVGMQHRRQVVGSPMYMAPEQANGDRLERTTDIWGLGVVLYLSLTGQHPYSRGDIGEPARVWLARLSHGDVLPKPIIQPEVSKKLAAVCLKCLQIDAANRFATAADLHTALCDCEGSARRWWF